MSSEYPCRFLTGTKEACRLKRSCGEHCTDPLMKSCNEYWPKIEAVI